MTDNEIIKALHICFNNAGCCSEYCPLIKDNDCQYHLKQHALNLINRQKAESERLSIELQAMRGAANSYKAENEKLLNHYFIDTKMGEGTPKQKAIKEFAEKLKEKAEGYNLGYPSVIYQMVDVDDIADHLLANDVVVVDTDIVSEKNRPLISHIAGYPIDEIIDLMEAERDGRVFIPPYKCGTVVYVLRSQTSNGKNLYLREERIDHYRTFDKRTFMIFESGRMSVDNEKWNDTVFLTKEEAEEKLKGANKK